MLAARHGRRHRRQALRHRRGRRELERRILELNAPHLPSPSLGCRRARHASPACTPTATRTPSRIAMPQYDAVLTYGGGPWRATASSTSVPAAYFSMYNGLDPETHYPVAPDPSLACDVAFLGNRLPDREARVEELFLRAAALAPDAAFHPRRRRLGRQANAPQRPLDRPRPHRRSQSRQLLRRHGHEHQPRLHGQSSASRLPPASLKSRAPAPACSATTGPASTTALTPDRRSSSSQRGRCRRCTHAI